ncbi:FAD-dependent oxidoreductase [Bauldia sp.]|uniref:NAD(P)/FAD-dependent oxidoreductase n=1 Tax=Bauldia sp. TaxID=2575872 RepID=UPI0025BD3FDD|nr:FAD-dependent oxidoreductase [Bauldia sp.]
MFENGIVVVGGGHGGSQAVASLRAEGYEGPLTLVSAESDIPYQRPPLSKAFLKEAGHELLPLRPASFYEKNDVTLMLDTKALAIDRAARQLRLAGDRLLPFDRLVLAPGSRARMPPIDGIDHDGVLSLRNAGDARQIRDRLDKAGDVVVVGGGFIGLEIAATARLLGKTVTVLEAADRLMGRVVAPEISAHFLSLHRGWGSDIRLDTPIGRVIGEGRSVAAVETASGDRIAADMVVIGIGVLPNVELGQDAGLATDNGIVVNALMETGAPEILALGDCAAFDHWELGRRVRLESVQNAVDQAKTAARTIVGRPAPFREVPWFWSDQGDVKLQMVGLSMNATHSVTRGAPGDGAFSVFHFDGDRLVAIDSVNRAADHMVGRKLLAAGSSPAPELCADEGFDLKSLIPRPSRG